MPVYELSQNQIQAQILGLEQRQSLEILQCSNLQLNQRLREVYFENPMLDYETKSEREGLCSWTGYFKHSSGIENRNQFVDKSNELRAYITEQLMPNSYSQRKWKIFEFMIEALEDTGYLTMDSSEIAELCSWSPEEVNECLQILQGIEPAGIFQKDLKSSLLYQVSKLPYKDWQLEYIIRYHLKDISEGKISKITREMNISTAQVRRYMEQIGELNVHLIDNLNKYKTHYVVPDIIAILTPNGWDVSLNDGWMGEYKINSYYEKMIDETQDQELKHYFLEKLKQAKNLIFQVEQRRITILQITRQVLMMQDLFFKNMGDLKPMSLSVIAQAVNKHSSTVSRAVKNKYLQYPQGTILLKDLFVRKTNYKAMDSKYEKKWQNVQVVELTQPCAIKKAIMDIIESENKSKPYSDQKIVNQLMQRGIYISRRTVTQYREQMGIWSSYNRKETD